MRLARHARRFGGFPALSGDGVEQFVVEEALMERLDRVEREQEARAARERAAADAERRVNETLQELRRAER